jgi:O-antigen ligase
LALGGVEVWAESPIEIAVATLFLFWAILVALQPEGRIYWSPLNWPLLGLIAIGLIQLAFHTTAYAFLTRAQLLRLAVYFLIFFLVTQAFRTRSDFATLVWFLVVLCFVVSLIGIIQYFTSSREIFWAQALTTQGEPFGPYVNRNHFAGFVELTLPLGIALMLFRGVHREQLALVALLAIVPASALVLSGSRGGIIGFAFELGVMVLLLRTQRSSGVKAKRLWATGIVALIAVAAIAWIGASAAIAKFSSLKSPEVSMSRRISMDRGAVHIFLDHALIGCGVGTIVDVFPLYETAYDGKVVDHVHNDYLETLAETGLIGGICGAAFLFLLFREARRSFIAEQGHFSRGFHAGAIAAVCGLLLHSLVDFNLQIPANAMLFLVQASIATGPALPSSSAPTRRPNRF